MEEIFHMCIVMSMSYMGREKKRVKMDVGRNI